MSTSACASDRVAGDRLASDRLAGILGVVLLGATLLLARPAGAQAPDRASAEELFQLGRSAMARQEIEKACGYFQASLDADFTLGTLLNLASCHERIGKIASAWAEYRVLEDRARRATPPQNDRVQFAQTHAAALRPRLSHVRIHLSAGAAATAGLVVKIDNAPAARELFEEGVPIDPGKRAISASAPDHETWSQVVSVDGERQTLELTVPPLTATPGKPSPPAVVTVPPPPPPVTRDGDTSSTSRRTVGFLVGGVGLASLAAGGVFGVLAYSASEDSRCPAPCLPSRTGDNPAFASASDAYDRANTLGWVSNITLATGLIAAAVGAYLVLTSPPRSSATLGKGY